MESQNSFRRTIERHYANIDWQIRRIYRARNHIMHKGFCRPGTRQLIQHLHSYYISTMHNLIGDLNKNEEWDISSAFEFRVSVYNMFIDLLKKPKEKPVTFNQLYNPKIWLMRTDKSESVWGSSST